MAQLHEAATRKSRRYCGAVLLRHLQFPGTLILLSPIIQVLPMGFIAALFYDKLKHVNKVVMISIAVGFYMASMVFPDYTTSRHFFLGSCTTLTMIALADISVNIRFAKLLGNTSYGVYLLHFPVVYVAALALREMFEFNVLATIVFWIGLIFSAMFGLFDHKLYTYLASKFRTPAS